MELVTDVDVVVESLSRSAPRVGCVTRVGLQVNGEAVTHDSFSRISSGGRPCVAYGRSARVSTAIALSTVLAIAKNSRRCTSLTLLKARTNASRPTPLTKLDCAQRMTYPNDSGPK